MSAPGGSVGPPAAEAVTDDPAVATEAGAAKTAAQERREALLAAVGGKRGIFDSGLPAAVFVAVNALSSLRVAIYVAGSCGAALLVWRLIRRHSVQQAVSGFVGLAISVAIAARLHKAEGFFLPGIVISAMYGAAFLGSALVRRPLVGYVVALVDGETDWRKKPWLVRAYTVATLGWALVFLLRMCVQGALYLADSAGWLAVAKLALGYPVTIAAVALTLAYLRRVRAGRSPTNA